MDKTFKGIGAKLETRTKRGKTKLHYGAKYLVDQS